MEDIVVAKVIDCRGLHCPMPVVKAGREMKALMPGDVLKIMATDKGSMTDIPAWSEDTGNELVEWYEEDGGVYVYFVKKGEEE